MLARLKSWAERRRLRRRRWQDDARRLVTEDELAAHREAQRLAARAKASRDADAFVPWANVAAEVARISPRAQMDLSVVQAIVDAELRRAAGAPPSGG